jgi:uncharacterized protein
VGSLGKILLFVAVIAIVWFGFKFLQRVYLMNQGGAVAMRRRATARTTAAPIGENAQAATQDMVACRVCGTYVEADRKTSCGRADCPYGR